MSIVDEVLQGFRKQDLVLGHFKSKLSSRVIAYRWRLLRANPPPPPSLCIAELQVPLIEKTHTMSATPMEFEIGEPLLLNFLKNVNQEGKTRQISTVLFTQRSN
jgi:hypothetical protein